MLAFTEADVTLLGVAALGSLATLGVGLLNFFGGRRGRKSLGSTGNDKDIGTTIHDTAQTVELIAAQTHTNTHELLGLSAKLDQHLTEAAPLNAYVKTLINDQGTGP